MQSTGKRATAIAHIKDTAKASGIKQRVKAKQSTDGSNLNVLTILLRRTEAQEAWRALSKAPNCLDDKQKETLLQTLQVLGLGVDEARRLALDPAPKKVHCVRCHQLFKERDNHQSACTVMHTCASYEIIQDWDGRDRETCTSCDWISEKYDRMPIMPDICFKGMHTTDQDRVEYGSTIESCEEIQCDLRDPEED